MYYDMYIFSCADIYIQENTATSPRAFRLSLALRLYIGISVQLRKPGQSKRLTWELITLPAALAVEPLRHFGLYLISMHRN
jgi:hypothetical protein